MWQAAGVVRHSFTHFDLELSVALFAGTACDLADGEWWLLDQLEQAGLPTLFTKAAQLVLAQADV
mgnify:CR=1 FL=1